MFIPLKDENPTRTFPFITVTFIVLNILIFLYQLLSPEGLNYYVMKLGAIPYEFTHFKTLHFRQDIIPLTTLFTSMFMHGGFFHIIGNMLYLWVFGNNVEDFLGTLKFILFYVLSGLVAIFSHVIFNPNSKYPLIGASGAIAGVLGAYLVLFPYAKIRTLVFLFFLIRVVDIPAAFFLIFWFFMQVLYAGMGGEVAWFAHIGGFLFGFLAIRAFVKKRRKRIYYH